MAAYSVLTLPRAEIDATEYARRIALDSPSAALRWIEGLEAAIAGLAEMPLRFARIPRRVASGASTGSSTTTRTA